MLLKLEKVGSIEFVGNVIDITDPCYDKEVFCRESRNSNLKSRSKKWNAKIFLI